MAAVVSMGLSGCVAGAAVPIMVASGALSGFAIFKSVQLSTGGEATIEMEENVPEPADQKNIRAAKSIAVWPIEGAEGEISERISELTYLTVIPPSKVRRWIDDQGYDRDASVLTKNEKEVLSIQLGRQLGADLILLVETGELTKAEANVWSFDRGNFEYGFDMTMVATQSKRAVWEESGRIVIELGGTLPGEREVNKIAQDAIAERVAQLVN